MLAVDPGLSTGFASAEVDGAMSVFSFEAWTVKGHMESVDQVRLAIVEGVDEVVCESFRISGATATKTQAGSLVAIEIIGAARWICYKRDVPFTLQTPADAKSFVTDEKLRALGWYVPGIDHSRDAARHLLLYLVRTGEVNVRQFLT